ncbi:MAG TPA: hypothetical protein VM689_17130 [Aliidongia sp.]|nr:hypothetical protein [Aliidongia sp.]
MLDLDKRTDLLTVNLLRRPRLLFILHIAAICLALPWLWLTLEPPTVRFDLSRTDLAHENGNAFILPLRLTNTIWVRFESDTPYDSHSTLTLSEDEKPLGPPHSSHEDIRHLGGGRFSHWGGNLYFSSSDNSTPADNGRKYTVEIRSLPQEWLSALAIGGILLILVWHLRRNQYSAAIYRLVLAPSPLFLNGYRVALLILLSIALSLALTWHLMTSGLWTGLAVGGWFQVSDAFGWWACAKNIAWVGTFSHYAQPWCERRPIYELFIGGLDLLGGASVGHLIWLQAAVIGLAIAWFAREAIRLAGALGGALAIWLIFWFCDNLAFGQTMSENAGLAFGLSSLALLLCGADRRSQSIIAIGIAGLSVGLSARIGAVFTLPLLVVWLGLSAWRWQQSVSRALLLGVLAAMAGPLLQAVIVIATDGQFADSGSNIAYTLYGLSVGGRPWASGMTDHPEIFNGTLSDKEISRALYGLALDNVKSNAAVLFQGIQKNFVLWQQQLLLISPAWFHDRVAGWLLPAGFIAIAWRVRSGAMQILALVFIGEALTAPFGYIDGGNRVLAATMPVDALIAGLGLQAAGAFISRCCGVRSALAFPTLRTSAFGGAVTLLGLGALIFLPIARGAIVAEQQNQPGNCAPGLEETIITLDQALMLRKVADGPIVPFQAMPVRYFTGKYWFDHDFAELAAGSIVLKFLSREPSLRVVEAVWPDAPPVSPSDRIDFCLDPTSTVSIAGDPHKLVASWRRLTPAPSPES